MQQNLNEIDTNDFNGNGLNNDANSSEINLEVCITMNTDDFKFNTVNSSTEKFLIDFVEDVISETKMGNLDWLVFYKTENNRQLRTCVSSDSNLKLTGVFDKGTLEKVSMNVKKTVLINNNNSRLLKVLEKLIDTAESRFNCKLDIPLDFIEGVQSYYKRNNKTVTPNKEFNKKKEELSNKASKDSDNDQSL